MGHHNMRNQRIALFEKLTTTSFEPSEGSSLPPKKMDSLLRKDIQDRLLASTYIFTPSHTQVHTHIYTNTHIHTRMCTRTIAHIHTEVKHGNQQTMVFYFDSDTGSHRVMLMGLKLSM